ncbi:HAD-IIA family hydrolase [Mycobacterium lentiflavum]|uniref:HAD-IIA family hydrolase n=1 Tax=Mycobacterium lentiflavum TaxID=141349 RepID=UPI001FD29790|nr:HAD-IIA family hydrolase [Mycobacterium lentiflavum]
MTRGVGAASLVCAHDCLLLDLDGTVFRGSSPTTGAIETLESIEARTLYLTNNASRLAQEVADHLGELGFNVDPADVVTSAQSAARLLGNELEHGSRVLVVGTEALATEVVNVGLVPVRSVQEAPAAVVQGHSPDTDWRDLAEAALAIRGGALWVACNIDATFPTERGLVPGNGSMVAALRAATGSEPIVVGKPQPTMLRDALARGGNFESPLVVGDRLDTDIAGANSEGLPSLLVLSGVSTAADLVCAPSDRHPVYVAEDLRGLCQPSETVRIGPRPGWRSSTSGDTVTIASAGDCGGGLSVVRAAAHAVWSAQFNGRPPVLRAGDDLAHAALEKWCLLDLG